ncbi:putative glycine rich nucleic binding domain containing protein [Lyophyllum shimeji]|uniref:Glycine rich nucleic binding domain containing protein n=1 Tax=Lyophyllum shimeji TaxID=47721 RepID=A0A9P3PGX9_LYOSH|nr:putative glycine rich nucleic binding domain containing protein [Lyophyllum shimeji]
MAFNREWDQGKDAWAESSWGGADLRSNVRPREDDYYGEGKRRKFNNGGFQGFDAPQTYEDSSHDRSNRQAGDHFQDYGQDDRHQRPGFNKKRLIPSEPSPHVIFLGLDPDFTEADLQAYLATHGCSIETVTIIRDKSTGSSKGFGFAQFTTTEHARAFVDPLFPFIQVPPPASHGASVTAAYYRSLEMGTPTNGRRVKIDYSQSASPHDRNRFNRGNTNDGTRDIGSTQSPVLLFRGLDPLSGPQAIHQAMLYSSGPTMKGAKGMKRIILIKDKVTMASFGFAFVEFVDVASASAVLAATMSPTIHPSGFRISDRPVAASFAHPYSFQPVTDFLSRDDACLKSSMSLGGVEGQWVRYWDENSTVAVLEFKVEEPLQSKQPVKEKKEKKKKTEVELRPAPAAPSALPVSDKPVTLSFNNRSTKATIAKPVTLGFSMDDVSGDPTENLEDSTAETSEHAAAKNVAPLIASKKTVDNINKWNQVQEELAQKTAVTPASGATLASVSGPSSAQPVSKPPAAGTPVPAEVEFEFSDVTGLMCLLCARQFKSLDQLKRHNKESDLHKARHFNAVYCPDCHGLTSPFKNFKDANLREVARQKVAARKAEAQPRYRDRASERRVLFNQPDVPVPEKDIASATKQRKYDAPPPPPSPPPPPVNPGQDANNVGNKLLKMMGWTEGTGLGTSGDGRVDPIQTAIYAQGAGLGASKGRDIAKYTEGYSGYVHMAQDAARERYGS